VWQVKVIMPTSLRNNFYDGYPVERDNG